MTAVAPMTHYAVPAPDSAASAADPDGSPIGVTRATPSSGDPRPPNTPLLMLMNDLSMGAMYFHMEYTANGSYQTLALTDAQISLLRNSGAPIDDMLERHGNEWGFREINELLQSIPNDTPTAASVTASKGVAVRPFV